MTGTDMPARAVLCDVDGVLRHRDRSVAAVLEVEFELPNGAIDGAALRPDLLHQVVTGRLSELEWRDEIVAVLAAGGADPAAAATAVGRWADPPGRVDEEVFELLLRAAARVPVVLVSNGTTRLEKDLRTLGVSARLPLLVNSARVGVAKPEQEIFLMAARLGGVAAHRCLAVDDNGPYLAGAVAAGMATHLYTGAAGLHAVLRPILGTS